MVANFNNLQTHPVCNVLSTNEINPSENIFNNNVMHNGISKIVKSWTFNQFPPEKQEAPATLHRRRGYNTTWHRRIAVIVQNHPLGPFGRKQESLIVLRVFRVWADSNLNVPGWPP